VDSEEEGETLVSLWRKKKSRTYTILSWPTPFSAGAFHQGRPWSNVPAVVPVLGNLSIHAWICAAPASTCQALKDAPL
jgi:hypothetical protein